MVESPTFLLIMKSTLKGHQQHGIWLLKVATQTKGKGYGLLLILTDAGLSSLIS